MGELCRLAWSPRAFSLGGAVQRSVDQAACNCGSSFDRQAVVSAKPKLATSGGDLFSCARGRSAKDATSNLRTAYQLSHDQPLAFLLAVSRCLE